MAHKQVPFQFFCRKLSIKAKTEWYLHAWLPYTLIKINFQRIRRLFWQGYLKTLWNSVNLPKNHMLATGFKADYDKTWSMQFWKIDSILIAQTGRFRDCCKNLLPLWKGFERINYVLLPLKSSDNYRFSEDFRRKKN